MKQTKRFKAQKLSKRQVIEQIKMNAWCWVFMALAVGFYILFQALCSYGL